MREIRFKVYEAKDGWRWRLLSGNNKIIADSGEAYSTASNARKAVRRIKQDAADAAIVG